LQHERQTLIAVAGETAMASGVPYLSTARLIFTPRIFFPPSIPRLKQLGAEQQDQLSITTALGAGASPQAWIGPEGCDCAAAVAQTTMDRSWNVPTSRMDFLHLRNSSNAHASMKRSKPIPTSPTSSSK
jgi:hypothetical protein